MTSKTLTALMIVAAALAGVACTTSHVERHFGEAYREAIARQTADPEGARANADEPAPQGLDGHTAEDVMNGYHAGQQPSAGPRLPLPMIVTDDSSLGN